MSTTRSQRVTRSASKARSTGVPSVGPSSRGRSRRAGSEALLGEDEKPDVNNQPTRAYGTEGKSAQAEHLSAQLGMAQAIDPIAKAVSNADAPQVNPHDNTGRLSAVSEETEVSEHSSYSINEPQPDDYQPSYNEHDNIRFSEPASIFSWQWWAPRRGRWAHEDRDRNANDMTYNGRVNTTMPNQPLPRDRQPTIINVRYKRSWSERCKDVVAYLLCFIFLLAAYEFWRHPHDTLKQDSLLNNSSNASALQLSGILSHQYDQLNLRIHKVEQHVQDLSLGSQKFEATPQHQINWFSPGFGTSIDVYLSSPTAAFCDPTWTGSFWSTFFPHTCREVPLSPPHMMALVAGDDPVQDAWCAPRSGGKLQLAVRTPRKIAPTELIVENAPKDAMPVGMMGTAPKEIELWIQITDFPVRDEIIKAIRHLYPELLEYSSPQGKKLDLDDDARALWHDYIPVGRWIYNIYEQQSVQTFKILIPLHDYGVSIDHTAVRVNSNWGNVHYTCINRLRLHGHDTSGIVEELEENPRFLK